jgi:hypothetical protein
MPSSLPFWDPGAAQQSGQTTQGGAVTSAKTTYPAILTAIPDLSSQQLDDAISPWEVVYFGKIRAPGIARVDGGRRRIVDPRMIPGSSGQIPTVMAFMPAEFQITLTMWTNQQWSAWQNLVLLLYPKPQPSQIAAQTTFNLTAVDVQHPAFAALSVTSVYVVDVRAPRQVAPQVLEATIDCIEFLPPMNEGVKPIQSSVSELSPGIYSPPAQPPSVRTPPAPPGQTDIGATAGSSP